MPGAPEVEFVLARRALLDALDALAPHLGSIVLVGAQAVYLHTADDDFAVPPFTTDVDLALDRARLADRPGIDALMTEAGFVAGSQPGTWVNDQDVPVDLLVADAVGGPGRRAARLGGAHGKRAARKVRGLEAVVLDATAREVRALDHRDPRTAVVAVAGASSLLVAKVHKLAERVATGATRLDAKDALDVFRLLRLPSERLARDLVRFLDDDDAGTVTEEALGLLGELFASPGGEGVRLAVEAVGGLEPPETISASSVALAREVLVAVQAASR